MELFLMELGLVLYIFILCYVIDNIVSNIRRKIRIHKFKKELKSLEKKAKEREDI